MASDASIDRATARTAWESPAMPTGPAARSTVIGTGETPTAPVFIDGRKAATLRGPTIAKDFEKMVADYIEERFGQGSKAAE